MYGTLMLTGPVVPVAELRTLLAEMFGVAAAEVWVQDETPLPDGVAAVAALRWSAGPGDVAWLLDVACDSAVPRQPSERELGVSLARRLRTAVLFPAESFPPSAYWRADPDGRVTRARVHAEDGDEEDTPTSYVVGADDEEA